MKLTVNGDINAFYVQTLCMIFFHFGWAKPVPIYTRNFKNPRKDCAIVALAGPLSNLIMALVSTFFYCLFYNLYFLFEWHEITY